MNRSRVDVGGVRWWRLLPLALGALGASACDNGDSLCPAVMYEGVIVTIDAAYMGLGGLSGLAVESQIADGEWFPCWGPHSTSELPSTHYLTCFTNRTAPMRVRATLDDGTVREDAFDLVGDSCGPFEPIRVALVDLPVVVEGSGEGSGDPDSCWAWITETNPTCAEGCAMMRGDDSFEACAFLPSTFSPVQPLFCHPRDAVVLTATCLQYDGQTYYIPGEPTGMEDLPGWTSCGCE